MGDLRRRQSAPHSTEGVLPDPEWHCYPLHDDFHWLRPIASCFILELPTPLRFRFLGQPGVHGACTWQGKSFRITPDKRTYWWRPPKTHHQIVVDKKVIGDLSHKNNRIDGSFNVSLPCGQYSIRAHGTRTAVFPAGDETPITITRTAWRDTERAKRHWAYVFCENPPVSETDAILCWLCVKFHFLDESNDGSL